MNRMRLSILTILAVGSIVTGTMTLSGGGRAADDPPGAPRRERPKAGSVFQMRIAADPRHDAEGAADRYRFFKLDPRIRPRLERVITKVEPGQGRVILVKLDPQNLTERDLLEVKATPDERGLPAMAFRLTRDGATRLRALTRAHLPEEQGKFSYHLAIIVEDVVVVLPVITSEIGDSGILQFSDDTPPKDVERMLKLLADAAASNAAAEKEKAEKK